MLGSNVLITASLIRPRAATARASRRPSSTRCGVGTPTLPPLIPAFVKDDGWFRLSGELFIVLRTLLAF